MSDAPETSQPTAPEVSNLPDAAAPAEQPKKVPLGIRIGGAVLGLAVAGGAAFGTTALLNAVNGGSKQQQIEKGVEEALAAFDPPKQIDEVTIITDVKAEEGAIHYYYTLTGVDPAAVTAEVLEGIVEPSVCSTSETRKVLDQDIVMRYSYEVEGTSDVYHLEFTKVDCA